ncbi:SGNH/GDSL hydrolase family protein [Streptomyces sp. NPDC091272]|uniref:SGNH/GDSL hydrolase family protein n=1 Tax=Streptomyces sp. NPDC091272 TaxID=3365981 RepID=UPI003800695C
MILDRRALLTTAVLTGSARFLPVGSAAPATRAPVPVLPATRAPVPVPPGRPLRYGVIGDSITGRGSFASSVTRSWTALLQARLAKTWRVTRVNGSTSQDEQGVTCLGTADSVPFGCDLVVVGLGSNDCLARRDGRYVYTPDDTYSAARALFSAMAAANPGAVVVGLGVWGDINLRWNRNRLARPESRVEYWDRILGEVCAENGSIHVPCADLYGSTALRLPAGRPAFGGYTTDGYHPNDAGHEAIYRRVAERLELP